MSPPNQFLPSQRVRSHLKLCTVLTDPDGEEKTSSFPLLKNRCPALRRQAVALRRDLLCRKAARDQQKISSQPGAGARWAWRLNRLQPSAGIHGLTTTFRDTPALPVAHQLEVQSSLSRMSALPGELKRSPGF